MSIIHNTNERMSIIILSTIAVHPFIANNILAQFTYIT